MSHDLRRISVFAVIFLVLLRISIGWQFLYEGLWKYQSQSTANPWTAKGYLLNAQGPLRPFFRNMVDDPDDLSWLDYDEVHSKWENFQKRFAKHYALTDQQKNEVDELLYGLEVYEVPLSRLPQGKEELISKYYGPTMPKILGFRPGTEPDQPGVLFVKKGQDYRPEHARRMHGVAPMKGEEEYHKAVDALYAKFTTGSKDYEAELEALLTDPGLTGEAITDKDGNFIEKPPGEIDAFKDMLTNYEEELATATRSTNYVHLKTKWSKIQEKKSELIGPVKKLDTEFRADVYKLLTDEQRRMAPLPVEPTNVASIDQRTMWALMILGGLLIAGFFSRVAALAGAGMVFMFYLASPPWPGVPPASGPEHAFIINKNLIEVIALIGLAFLPTGSWFGVDGIFRRLFSGDKYDAKPQPTKGKKDSTKKPVAASK